MGVFVVLVGIALLMWMFQSLDKAKRRVGELEDALKRIRAHAYPGYFGADQSDARFREYTIEAINRVMGPWIV